MTLSYVVEYYAGTTYVDATAQQKMGRSQQTLDKNAWWAESMTKRMLHGEPVERLAVYLCDDIAGEAHEKLERVVYQAKAYSGSTQRFCQACCTWVDYPSAPNCCCT